MLVEEAVAPFRKPGQKDHVSHLPYKFAYCLEAAAFLKAQIAVTARYQFGTGLGAAALALRYWSMHRPREGFAEGAGSIGVTVAALNPEQSMSVACGMLGAPRSDQWGGVSPSGSLHCEVIVLIYPGMLLTISEDVRIWWCMGNLEGNGETGTSA